MTKQSMCKVVCFDLDDTLYKEVDYVKSAYHEIAAYMADLGYGRTVENYRILISAFDNGRSAFQELNDKLDIDMPISEYLRIYREHKPDIELSSETKEILKTLVESGYKLGLISDGRSITQRNKIDALGLERFIRHDDIVISEEFGSEKPSLKNYSYFEERYPYYIYFYIGDNPQKDFLAPNKLGWTSICLLDDGQNIHSQDFDSLPPNYLPAYSVNSLNGILPVINNR